LRERVKLAGVHSARHEIVSRAFGRRLGKDRSFDLEISALVQIHPSSLHQAMTQLKILLQLRPSQIEMAVTQSQFFSGQLFSLPSRNRNCGSLCRADQSDRVCAYFDIAGSKLGVPHFRGPKGHFAAYGDDALLAECGGFLDFRQRSPLWVEGDLNYARAVATIEEDNPAQIS
jgi:hypothetical protein